MYNILHACKWIVQCACLDQFSLCIRFAIPQKRTKHRRIVFFEVCVTNVSRSIVVFSLSFLVYVYEPFMFIYNTSPRSRVKDRFKRMPTVSMVPFIVHLCNTQPHGPHKTEKHKCAQYDGTSGIRMTCMDVNTRQRKHVQFKCAYAPAPLVPGACALWLDASNPLAIT